MSSNEKRWKWLGAIAGLVVALQLVPIERDNPPVEFDLPAPPAVKSIMKQSCYDCHSHETTWPWYGYVAPVSWYLAYTIAEARSEFNVSTWKTYRPDKRRRLLRDALEEIEKEAMPPWEYLLLHGEARLSEQEHEILRDWITATED
ncbi:MAG: heme-binding domain-containing protein [Myxococcales bacterium]|nr:heme-binding domain-containing protein [Myxococcales bacterium]